LGLLSTGGVHASIDHIYALLELANKKQIKNVFLHVILDGRDMNYNSGLGLINDLEKKIKELGVGKIASISGRFWAMDRDNRWQRIEKAYQAMVLGQAENKYKNAQTAVKESYAKKIYDEEFEPAVIINSSGKAITQIKQHDAVIFANYRADRGRQLAKAFVLPGFDKFERDYIEDLYFASMTQYDKDLPIEVAYPPEIIEETLAENIAAAGLRQLHIAETEKYAHVTYFLNGGNENKSQGEDHILIPSPKVDSYSQKPEMSAKEVKDKILKEIQASKYDFIVVNFANPDMVGHTGDLKAGIKAVEYTDRCLGEIIESLIQQDGVAVVIADHGNVEEMINEKTGEIDKEHSSNPVPCLIIGREFKNSEESSTVPRLEFLTPNGILADVAPTILKILNIKKPDEMTGRSLI